MEEPKKIKLPSPQERMELILMGLARKVPVKELCRQAGVSRELFYRWLRRFRKAGLLALEAEDPGPKEKVEENPREQIRELKERIEDLKKRERKLRKSLEREKMVSETAQRIIRRNAWGPMPEAEPKKNAMRAPKSESNACVNGMRSDPEEPALGRSPEAGESTGARTGDGPGESSKGPESA
jgi:transposase-like protein